MTDSNPTWAFPPRSPRVAMLPQHPHCCWMSLDCIQKEVGKERRGIKSPDALEKGALSPGLVESRISDFSCPSLQVFLRKSPLVTVNRIGPVQPLIFSGADTIRPLQLKLSRSTFFCVSVELNPILPLHRWRGSHPGREVEGGNAKDGHTCSSLFLEPYSLLMPSKQQEETLVWANRSRECTERGKRKAWMSTRSKREQGELWDEGRERAALRGERSSQQGEISKLELSTKQQGSWFMQHDFGRAEDWDYPKFLQPLDRHHRVSSFLLQLLLACAGLLAASPPAGTCCVPMCCK